MTFKYMQQTKFLYYATLVFILSSIVACNSKLLQNTNTNNVSNKVIDTSLIPASAFKQDVSNFETHPLSENITSFLKAQTNYSNFKETGLNKDNYLLLIEAQVKAMLKYQDKEGRIIDPIEKVEKYYTTPCYAHAVSVLVASSTIEKNSQLALSGMKALDIALTDMVNATVNGNHGDFYTWPVMLAYKCYKEFADENRLNSWNKKLSTINIKKLYAFYNKERNLNWILVHASGEFLRASENFTSMEYAERMIKFQLENFTNLGMYDEHGNPLAYDIFARHYLNGMLQYGYKGEHYLTLKNNLWKGAWTSLFMQSPFGELPTGNRSSHHIWNEAEQCVIFEIYANAYAKSGKLKEAGAFKRAAMLSLKSMQNWVREDGSGYIVKNRFPIEKKHGYERYSVHTCYNMLAMSMLAQAWEFSNTSIKESPSPADTGGYVLSIPTPFHKIFANLNGNYIEYDTKGDQKYNPTGILRVHLKDGHPQLGPSDGIAELYGGKDNVMALGSAWLNTNGTWTYLSKSTQGKPTVTILNENSSEVKFNVIFTLNELVNQKPINVTETITITANHITVENDFKAIKGTKRLVWPMLIHDGEQKISIEQKNKEISLSLKEKGVKWSVLSPKDIDLSFSKTQYNHRNGIVSPLYAEFKGDKIIYRLEKLK